MAHRYLSQIMSTGPGDLVSFRDAVLTYCAALKEKQPFHFQGSDEAGFLLSWLGVEYLSGTGEGRSYQDPSRANGGEVRLLPSGTKLPQTPLASFRDKGYLGTTLFAALVRSSYGPDEPGYFPTRSELGFYFEESALRRESRWDEDYLEECQDFFFEELTPAELVAEAFSLLGSEAAERGAPFREALEGVAFLIGEQTRTLLPLAQFFQQLLVSREPLPELREIASSDDWSVERLEADWGRGPLSEYGRRVFTEPAVKPHLVLQACGPELLRWRAGQ